MISSKFMQVTLLHMIKQEMKQNRCAKKMRLINCFRSCLKISMTCSVRCGKHLMRFRLLMRDLRIVWIVYSHSFTIHLLKGQRGKKRMHAVRMLKKEWKLSQKTCRVFGNGLHITYDWNKLHCKNNSYRECLRSGDKRVK